VTQVASEEQVKLDKASHPDPKQLLTTIFDSSPLGFAILDDQLRFLAINKTLAEMNGIPLGDHLGKTIREVLGPVAAARLEPKLARTFATGESVCFHLATALPTRTKIGHRTVRYFPIEKLKGCVNQVCAIVTERTARRELELYLFGFSRKLLSLRVYLNLNMNGVGNNGYSKLLDSCISEMIAISKLPGSPLNEITAEVLGQYEQLSLASVAAGQLNLRAKSSASTLPRRARQVVQQLAQGRGTKEIAQALGISVRTVETYRAKLKVRLGLHSTAELVAYAIHNNIV
jgi:DNA-binding CsgD family transcriptional regulator